MITSSSILFAGTLANAHGDQSDRMDAHPVPPNMTTRISLARTGGTYYELLRWTDPDSRAPWTVIIDWGDGEASDRLPPCPQCGRERTIVVDWPDLRPEGGG